MKINIVGKGIIPGMGILPPVYNIEKSETDVRRLTNFRNIRVYCSENGLLITKKNVDSFFKVKPNTTTKTDAVKPKTVDGIKRNILIEQEQQKQKEETPVVIEETPIETIVEETITTEEDIVGIDEIESVIEETVDEEEVVMTEEETVEGGESEEVVKEETKQPQTYSSKKKNRNKNRK